MKSYATIQNTSTKVFIPELVDSGIDLSHCIDCSYGRRHIHHSLVVRNTGFGFLKKIFKALNSIVKGIANVTIKVGKFIASIVRNFVRASIRALTPVVKKLIYLAGSAMVYLNPTTVILRGLRSWKLTANLTKQVDRYTGGAITSWISINSIPGHVVRGDKIPKEELIRDALFAARIAAVAVSGGTATAIVGAVSNQLQQGELGQSELGRTVLSIGQIVAIAAATGQAWQEVAKRQAVNTAGQAAAKEAAQETALGKSEAGRFLINATLAGATASVNGTTAQEAIQNLAKSTSRQIAIREIAEELNIPYADKIAKSLVDNLDKITDPNEIKKAIGQIDFNKAIESVKRAAQKMPDVFNNLKMPDITKITTEVSKLPATVVKVANQVIKETSEIPEDVAKAVSQLRPPTKDEIKDFIKKLKEVRSDFVEFVQRVCFTQNIINQATGLPEPIKICKNSLARLPIESGDKIRYIYYFDDGTIWASPFEDKTGIFKIAALVGAGLLIINQIKD